MIELYGLILAVAGVVIGWLLSRYGYGKYINTVNLVIKALEDKKITKEEAKAILNSLLDSIDKDDHN